MGKASSLSRSKRMDVRNQRRRSEQFLCVMLSIVMKLNMTGLVMIFSLEPWQQPHRHTPGYIPQFVNTLYYIFFMISEMAHTYNLYNP